MLALADHAHDDGSNVRPGILKIAWKTGYTHRHVKRVLSSLRDSGVLVLVREATQHMPNEYRIDLTKAPKKPTYAEFRASIQGGPDVPAGSRGDIGDARGDIGDSPGGTPVSPEPSVEPSVEPETLLPPAEASEPLVTEHEARKRGKKWFMKHAAQGLYGADFDERFWLQYPRGRRHGKPGGDGSKQQAFTIWVWDMDATERDAAAIGVKHYADAIERDRESFVPHASTWLNQRRWETWQEPASPPPPVGSLTTAFGGLDRHSDDWGVTPKSVEDMNF